MIETILSRLKEEIGIDGSAGSNITKVWQYVETITTDIAKQSSKPIVPNMDESYKSFLWNYIKMEPHLGFFKINTNVDLDNGQTTNLVGEPTSEYVVVEEAVPDEDTSSVKAESLEEAPVSHINLDTTQSQTKLQKKIKAPKKKPKKKAKKRASVDSEDDFAPDDDIEDISDSDLDGNNYSEESDDDSSVHSKNYKKTGLTQRGNVLLKSNPKNITPMNDNETKLDFSKIENIEELSYERLVELYGDKVYLIASEELQNEQLFLGIPHGVTLSPNLTVILKEILRNRTKGLYQASITKLLSLDSRSTGHYVKTLEEKGAIVRKGVSINGMFTNVCVHTRFNKEKEYIDMSSIGEDEDQHEMPYNVSKQGKTYSQHDMLLAIAEFAKDSPSNVVLSRDILLSLGFNYERKSTRKWFNRVIDELCLKGYLKKSNIKKNNTGKFMRSLHLLKTPEEMTSGTQAADDDTEQVQFPLKIKSSKIDIPIVHQLIDTPFERQIVQVIEATGVNGATQRDIQFALNTDEKRALLRILEKMLEIEEEHCRVVRHLEFEGRERRYRYYTAMTYFEKTKSGDAQPPPRSESVIDESKAFEKNIFYDLPHEMKPYKKYLAAVKASGGGKNVTMVEAEAKHAARPVGKRGRPKKNALALEPSNRPAKQPRKSKNQTTLSAFSKNASSESNTAESSTTEPNPAVATTVTDPPLVYSPAATLTVASSPTVNPSTENTTVETASLNNTPSENTSTKGTPSEDALIENAQIQNAQTENTQTESAQIENTQAENMQIENTPVESTQVENISLENTLIETISNESMSVDNTPSTSLDDQKTSTELSENISADTQPVSAMDVVEAKALSENEMKYQSTLHDHFAPATNDVASTTSSESSPNNAQLAIVAAKDRAKVGGSGWIVTARHLKAIANPYLEARVKILDMILQEQPIVEIGKNLNDIYTKKANEHNVSNKNICNKTLWRTATEMNRRGLAKIDIVECPLLNGKTMVRKLLIRHDIDKESVQYRNYIRYLKERRAMIIPKYSFAQVELIDASNIETMDQRIERMKRELADLKAQGDDKAVEELEGRINDLSENWQTFKDTSGKTQYKGWMINAIQFGWVNASMVRCKITHQYLFHLSNQDVEDVNTETSVVSLKAIILNMTLHTVCQIIGLLSYTEEVANYINESGNSSKLVKDLPKNVKVCIFSEHNRFRRRLHGTFKILEFLGLIEPITAPFIESQGNAKGVSALAPEYKILKTVPIRDYKRKGYPVLREYQFDDNSDLIVFWSELQYACTTSNTDMLSEDEVAPEPQDKELKGYLTAILTSKNWSIRSVYTKAQKKILNSYVDKINYTTPLGKPGLLKSIANSLELHIEDVRSYYQKVQGALERKLQHSELKRVERILIPRRKRGKRNLEAFDNRVINLSSTRAFKRPKRVEYYINPTKMTDEDAKLAAKEKAAIHEQRAKGQNLYLDDLGDLPVVPDDSNANLRKARIKRNNWSPQEDDLLLYSCIILRQRASKARFFWSAIKQVFPDRNPNLCRNRYSKMMQNPIYVEQFETNSLLWRQFYDEGIKSGELEDFDPQETIEFDLLGFVTYFIRRLSERNENKSSVYFPVNLEELRSKYTITRKTVGKYYHYEDLFHEAPTLVKKLQVLLDHSLTLRRGDDVKFDQSENLIEKENVPEYRQSNLIRLLCLMILLTPSELYDQFYCYGLLQRYPPDVLKKTYESMNNDQTLIRQSGARPIPGTRMSLSARFMKTMSGELPQDMLKQAKEYEKFLGTQATKIRYSPTFVSSGMMACVLNLLSSYRLSITFANMENHMSKINASALRGRKIDLNIIRFDVDIEKTDNADYFMPYIPQPDEVFIKNLDEQAFKMKLNELAANQDEYFADLLKKITDLLYQEAQLGCTLYQLKSKLSDATDENIIRAIHALCSNNPALVCRVGFDSSRYVHVAFIEDWAITPRIAPPKTIKELLLKSNNRIDITKKKPIIIPNLWTDINGDVTDVILKGCKEAIVDLVLRKPGITEADIHRHLNTALTRREIRDLLNMLVEQQVLRQVQTSVVSGTEKKHSIFGKTKLASSAKIIKIEKLSQSCFWVTPFTYVGMA